MEGAESDSDRTAVVLGEASCHSQLGNVTKSRELLEWAKIYAQGNRTVFSQVALAEASLDAQSKDYELACEKFASFEIAIPRLACSASARRFCFGVGFTIRLRRR